MSDDTIGFIQTRSAGFTERIDSIPERIPEYDPRSGNHFWILLAAYKVDPVKAMAGEQLLDHESLMSMQGPGCYYCEQVYTSHLLHRRCPGEPK